jgi:hypothetical protein
MKTGKIVGYSILAFISIIIIVGALDLGFGWFGVFKTKTIGKQQQNANREVFKETQSYVDGMAQELSNLKFEYDKATEDIDKKAIENKIRHDFADFNENNLQSEDLRTWLKTIRGF